MTGKTIEGVVTDMDSSTLYYHFVKRNGKTKPKTLDLERVFSITDSSGKEVLVYEMDTAIGNYFTVDEMRYYIYGEQDAMNGYRANWTWYAGIPITAGMGFGLSNSVLVFAVPFVYLVGASLPGYNIKASTISHPNYARQPSYILGYERTARTRRLFKALGAAVIGTTIGVIAGQSILN
ncbi:MAG: hypothetical protein Kow0075_12910 [Salibacteraceae bacterium]